MEKLIALITERYPDNRVIVNNSVIIRIKDNEIATVYILDADNTINEISGEITRYLVNEFNLYNGG